MVTITTCFYASKIKKQSNGHFLDFFQFDFGNCSLNFTRIVAESETGTNIFDYFEVSKKLYLLEVLIKYICHLRDCGCQNGISLWAQVNLIFLQYFSALKNTVSLGL